MSSRYLLELTVKTHESYDISFFPYFHLWLEENHSMHRISMRKSKYLSGLGCGSFQNHETIFLQLIPESTNTIIRLTASVSSSKDFVNELLYMINHE